MNPLFPIIQHWQVPLVHPILQQMKRLTDKNCFTKQPWSNIKDHLLLYFTTQTLSCTHLTRITFICLHVIIYIPAFPSLPLQLICTLNEVTNLIWLLNKHFKPTTPMCWAHSKYLINEWIYSCVISLLTLVFKLGFQIPLCL